MVCKPGGTNSLFPKRLAVFWKHRPVLWASWTHREYPVTWAERGGLVSVLCHFFRLPFALLSSMHREPAAQPRLRDGLWWVLGCAFLYRTWAQKSGADRSEGWDWGIGDRLVKGNWNTGRRASIAAWQCQDCPAQVWALTNSAQVWALTNPTQVWVLTHHRCSPFHRAVGICWATGPLCWGENAVQCTVCLRKEVSGLLNFSDSRFLWRNVLGFLWKWVTQGWGRCLPALCCRAGVPLRAGG